MISRIIFIFAPYKNYTMLKKLIIYISFVCFSFLSFAQSKSLLSGIIVGEDGKGIELVNIGVVNLEKPIGTTSDANGKYSLSVPSGKDLKLIVSCIGYATQTIDLVLKKGENKQLNLTLKKNAETLGTVEIKGDNSRIEGVTRITTDWAKNAVGPTGGVENLLKTLDGVSSNNELSSQYSVRGGNFDENLVYVNDIEIFRPLLVKNAQQEGLSFINSDMVGDIVFSSGGFDAKYGDKMSSVLDIRYRKPQEFGGNVSLGLLGASLHLEGVIGSRFTCQMGYRRKTNKYLLNSLETQGEYKPTFNDFQIYLTYDLNEKTEIAFLGNIADNKYNFIPETRETSFGNFYEMLKLKIYFDGQELDRFSSAFGALMFTYKPKKDLVLKLISSAFTTGERVNYDIQGQYYLYETGLGYEDEEGLERGIGTYIEHARNYLSANIYNIEHKGVKIFDNGNLSWGLKWQYELIDDRVNEWKMVDSSGYSIPSAFDNIGIFDGAFPPLLNNVFKSDNLIASTRLSAYAQKQWIFSFDYGQWYANLGARVQWWDYNKEFFPSPRASISFKPNIKQDLLFRFACGLYAQSPFYKELKDEKGEVHNDVLSQKSLHFVFSSDWNFNMLERPFKLMASAYYKHLWDLNPYYLDNVQLRYMAENIAVGYARGIDVRLFGEMIKGIDSWISFSLMNTEEDIEGDGKGYIPRPTDQLYNISISFQDYIPNMPFIRAYLSFNYGNGYPFGAPNTPRYMHTNRMPDYLRADIAFTFRIKDENTSWAKNNFLKHLKKIWVNVECFNVFSNKNVVSYFWVADYSNKYYGVPNYLTPFQLNAKLTVEF